MSQSAAFDFSKFVPGFDFLQKLATGNPSSAPSASAWVAPTLDPQELERRIKDLRAVRFWLEQNTQAVAATIQALEVQRMTLATLQGMNVSMGELAEALKVKPAQAQAPASDPSAATGSKQAGASKASKAAKTAKGAKATAEAAGGVDPMAWWGSLTQQFQQIAGDALSDMQRKAQTMAPAGVAPSASDGASAPKSPAQKTAARKAPSRSKAKK